MHRETRDGNIVDHTYTLPTTPADPGATRIRLAAALTDAGLRHAYADCYIEPDDDDGTLVARLELPPGSADAQVWRDVCDTFNWA